MPAKAMLLCVLAACPALARAERSMLAVLAPDAESLLEPVAAESMPRAAGKESLMAVARSAESARAANQTGAANQTVSHDASPDVHDELVEENKTVSHDAEPVEGSLEYKALDSWRTDASGQVDGVVSEEKDTLDPAATEGLNAAEKYAQMLNGLDNGFGTLRSAIGDFRAAEKGLQGRQNEEVRQTLTSARVESGATANVSETPGDKALEKLDEAEAAEHEVKPTETPGDKALEKLDEKEAAEHEVKPEVKHEDVVPQEPHASPLSESTVGGASHETDTMTESDVGDISHEAEKLTGHAENEAKEEDAVEGGSVVRNQTSQETKRAITDLEQQLQNGEVSGDTQATEQAVKNLVEEEEEQQSRVTAACYALADSPLKGEKRKCNDEVVPGIIEAGVCEGHVGDLQAACSAADKCQTKHVCVNDGAVIESDGSWEVNDNPTCDKGSAQHVCVPKAGDFKLPVAA
jgi:hypothetical protein